MPNQTTFTLTLELDGADVKKQAAQLRQAFEAELGQGLTLHIDAAGAKAATSLVNAVGKNADALKVAGQVFAKFGAVDAKRMEALATAMKSLLTDARQVGGALSGGLLGNMEKVEASMVNIQSKLSGIVRQGQGRNIAAGLLEDMPEMQDALADNDKKAFELAEKLRLLRKSADEAAVEMARLNKLTVRPAFGGPAGTLADLFKGFDSDYVKGKIRKAMREIDRELAPMEKTITAQIKAATGGLEAERERLAAEVTATGKELERLLESRPGAQFSAGLFDEEEEEGQPRRALDLANIMPREEWDAMYAEVEARYLELDKRLQEVRGELTSGIAGDLRTTLEIRRKQMEEELLGDSQFWREWATGSIEETAQLLRQSGQSAAADALEELKALTENYNKAESGMKRAFGGLQAGQQVELKPGAEGTLVDMVTAERALGDAAAGADKQLSAQISTLGKLTTALDTARMAADGLGKAERFTVERLEAAAVRDIRKRTPAKVPLAEAGPAAGAVLAQLAQEIEQATAQAMDETTAELADPEVTAAAVKQSRGILAAFTDLYDKLVGHSIIPDMVNAINEWLARIDPDFFGAEALVVTAETTAQEVVAAFADLAQTLPTGAIAARLTELQVTMGGITQELQADMLRGGSQASARYLAAWEDTKNAVRQIRQLTSEEEGKLAAGMLPRGFSVQDVLNTGEVRYQKSGGKRLAGIDESTDEWYQAIKTELTVKERYTQEEKAKIEKLLGELADQETQFATLVQSLYERTEYLAEAVAQAADPTAELQELEEVAQVLAAVAQEYQNLEAAQEGAQSKLADLSNLVATEAQIEAQAAQKVERAAASTPAARAEAAAQIEAEKRYTAEVVGLTRERVAEAQAEARVKAELAKQATVQAAAAARAQQAQKTEQAKRTTVKTRGAVAVQVVDAKAQAAAVAQQAKLLAEAQKLAGELGFEWREIEASMQGSGESLAEVVGQLKQLKTEQAAFNREQAANLKLTENLKQQAVALGVPWDQVEQAIQTSGLSLKQMQGVMQRLRRAQAGVGAGVNKWDAAFSSAERAAQGLGKAISDARNEYQGITQLAGDLQSMGTTLQQTGGVVTGALTLAGKSYLDFERTSNAVARTMGLGQEMTAALSAELITMAGDLALVSPEELAAGMLTYAKAVGQTANTQEELRNIMAQTIPAQKLAVLGQEDLNLLLEAGSNTMRAYSLRTSDLEKVMALFAKTADITTADIAGLSEGIKFLGPTAAQFNIPLEDSIALLGLLSEQGIQGSMAGTGLRRALNDIIKPTDAATTQLKALFGEVQPFFEGGAFIGAPAMIDKLAAAMQGLSDEERAAALAQIFDQNAITALTPLIEAQIAAREQGINVARAFSKNLQGVRDTEVEAWAAMKEAEEGVIVDMRGAVETLNQQWASYEQSNLRTIDILQARWQEFNLVIGEQGVALVLPLLDQAAGKVERIIGIAAAHPELTQIAATVATGALAGGTLLNMIGSLARSAVAIKSVVAGFNAWKGTQAGFQTAVVSSAEQFKIIVTQAAAEAAGIELQGAEAEATVEKSSAAGNLGAVVGAAGLIAAGVVASGVAVSLINKLLEETGAAQNIREAQTRIKATGRYYQGVPGMADRPEDAARAQNAYAARYAALAEAELAKATEQAGDAVLDLTGNMDGFEQVTKQAGPTLEQQRRAAELYVELLQRQKEATADFNAALGDALSDLNADLAQMAVDFASEQQEAQADYYTETAKLEAEHQQQQQQALADHQKQMARMAEDHARRVFDLEIARDAAGLYKEQQSYAVEKRRAEEDFAGQTAQEQANYEQQKAERALQHADRMVQLAVEYEQQKAARIAEYQAQVAELQSQHQADMARLQQEYFDKINAEVLFFQQSAAQQDAYYAQMYNDAAKWLQAKSGLWQQYVAALPTPGQIASAQVYAGGYVDPGTLSQYATGGYTGSGGAAMLHAGEFVMSADTTRQVEAATGGRLSQQGVAALGRQVVEVNANFTGMGPNDRGWFEAKLRDFERELVGVLGG